jgi:DNA-binding MarR family transcriptional regulator/N-acetylglutamate synthase-like GNAT family acetyltransferase
MGDRALEQRTQAVRRFNRYYTRRAGLLQEGLLLSPFSLTEARVLFELAHREAPAASTLARDLGLDAGYLSRILRQFQKTGLLLRRRSPQDGRQSLLSLTARGRGAAAQLDSRARDEVAAMLQALPADEQEGVVKAMKAIERLLTPAGQTQAQTPCVLRPPESGDFGRVIQLHGALYAREYGWDETFEALVAEIVARYAKQHDPRRERAWIAECDGQVVGCVFVVKKSANVAQLRLLLVDPRARGRGLGRLLLAECLRFARGARYQKLVLWTNDVLHAARHLYEEAGFRRTAQDRHRSFGHDLVGETWELAL